MTGWRPAVVGALALATATLAGGPARAVPLVPSSDAEVVQVLPASAGERGEEARARRQLQANPRDPVLAVAAARRYLRQAHELGDPRFAGLALAVVQPWSNPAETPDPVLLVQADLQQYLHDFDGAAATLGHLLGRPSSANQPQPWLTLATVRRVQGRYADSDAACRQVLAVGATLHGQACLAENAALRGDVDAARRTFMRWIGQPGTDAGTRLWLLTSLAELEQRDGHPEAAERAYREALRLGPDDYARLAFADFLIEQHRPGEALQALQGVVRSDAVLLRLAIAGRQAQAPTAMADVAEMRERIEVANERPEARRLHGREQAMFALSIDHDASLALELARLNIQAQREPLDLLVLAAAARASGDPAARQEVGRLRTQMGLHDRRLDALL